MIVRLDVWGVQGFGIARAFTRMATDRLRLRSLHPRPHFSKLLGTGSGETFTMRDADLRHWALLTTWSDPAAAAALGESGLVSRWASLAHEHATFTLAPISSHGQWAGREPFATESGRTGEPEHTGAVAAITRARIKPREWMRFWRSVPPVSDDLRADPAVLFTLGIGEAPVGLQGTFSVWRDAQAIRDFAYRRPAHAAVVARTHERGWYAEELFARFAVLDVSGSYKGAPPL